MERLQAEGCLQVPAGQLCFDRTALSITLGFMGKVGVRRVEEDWTGA